MDREQSEMHYADAQIARVFYDYYDNTGAERIVFVCEIPEEQRPDFGTPNKPVRVPLYATDTKWLKTLGKLTAVFDWKGSRRDFKSIAADADSFIGRTVRIAMWEYGGKPRATLVRRRVSG